MSEGEGGSGVGGVGGVGESSGYSEDGGVASSQESVQDSQRGGPAYQDSQARQGIAALYNAVQALSERMKGVDSLQERLSPLFEDRSQQRPQIEDYDGTLLGLQKQVEALAKYFETDQRYRKDSWERRQQEIYRQRQAQLQHWVANKTEQIDQHLEAHGYPGFAESAQLVRSFIESEYGKYIARVGKDSREARAATRAANTPQFWADVYVQYVIPAMSQRVQRFNSMAELRAQTQYVPPSEQVYTGRHVWR